MSRTEFYGLIEQAQHEHMYGEITFTFRDGVLTFIRTTRTEPATKQASEDRNDYPRR